jgi:LacI family transcriptional regulator
MTSGIDGELAGPWAGADRPTADPDLPLAGADELTTAPLGGADELKAGARSGPDESPTGDDPGRDDPGRDDPGRDGPGGDGIDIDGVDSDGDGAELPPTIYDVARAAGVSIASVSRVLNGTRNPREETRDRVLQAVAELGFVPDGAARALSVRLKEVVGVVVRRPQLSPRQGMFAAEDENLQFPDMINRGMELVAQRYSYDLLIRSVDLHERDGRRIFALARKSDGLILHDWVLETEQLIRLGRQAPVVTIACVPTPTTVNVRSDNEGGIAELVRHLTDDHGYRSLGYLAGHPDSPDNVTRAAAMARLTTAAGVEYHHGPRWQGDFSAAGGLRVIERLLAAGEPLPRAIVCGNDQTAIGVLHALADRGIDVPGQVAVCGFDDIPVSRHLSPSLTSVRQPIQELGATAFETLHAMIGVTAPGSEDPRGRDIVLPTQLNRRESCGCGQTGGSGGPGAPSASTSGERRP